MVDEMAGFQQPLFSLFSKQIDYSVRIHSTEQLALRKQPLSFE